MNWRALAVLVVFAFFLGALPAPGFPAPAGDSLSPQQAPSFNLEGKITQTEPGKFTVNTEENILFHIRYNEQTEIKRADGSAGSEKDLKVGSWVHVAGELSESGEITAAKIELQEQRPPRK